MKKLCIIGNGGLARELKAYLSDFEFTNYESYVSDEFHKGESDYNNGVYPLSEFQTRSEDSLAIIAISDPKTKQAIEAQLPSTTAYFSFIHPTATLYSPQESIGDGCIIGPNACITTDVTIGRHTLINCNVTVGHDAIIGDYCTINPHASISGNCTLGNGVFIGAAAATREKITVSSGTIIGMGTIVVRDILESNGTYVGVPARKLGEGRYA